ncbi:CaiB/BaiF CoA-transferase family protein [Actinomycetes bacterium KLBMP 9797]
MDGAAAEPVTPAGSAPVTPAGSAGVAGGGPLAGLRVVEMAAIGPVPFAAMLLADLGADVVKVDRPTTVADAGGPLHRGRPSVAVDLTHPEGVEVVLRLVESADVLLEGQRPGVMEGLGLGPRVCRQRNRRLVYGRMTGWGQTGPAAGTAGHDINFIAVAGALRSFAAPGAAPVPPLNLLGDFGGGGMLLAFGVLCAVLEARGSGQGQVVDAAMVDGTVLLTTMLHAMLARGEWTREPGGNLLDGAAPFYTVYEAADGEYVSVGAVEPYLYRVLLDRVGWREADLPDRDDRSQWPELRRRFAALFRTRTRDEWCRIFDGTDACVTPVLYADEAPHHPHHVARGTFVTHDGTVQPAPAPRFSRTPGRIHRPASLPGADTDETLAAWGFDPSEIEWLRGEGAIGEPR